MEKQDSLIQESILTETLKLHWHNAVNIKKCLPNTTEMGLHTQ